ncbi:hypothetical protein [Streptomyces sp. NPDC014006]|uniref:hypothetical protein n=1 Tax=Streptomyces sp. NPDC014006 TaxID=3364870 RepID=UPI003700F2A9
MSGDTGGDPARHKRSRALEQARVGWPRALRELKDLLYEVYLAAGAPSLDDIAADIDSADAEDHAILGAPSRDTVRRIISDPVQPPNQADVVSVAVVLARGAAWDASDLAGRVRDLWVQARMAQGVGLPLGEFDDRRVLADLEVHPALDTGNSCDRFGVLPAYVQRAHDERLAAVVDAAETGRSGIAVLVGGSSTGKTRALWEAVRELPASWRLWHPLSPARPDAVLGDLEDIAPRTVVWLNEAQLYLGPDQLGEQVAAGVRSLLHDQSRAPVLVLATLWPEHWDVLTIRTDPDRHAQARELLHGHKIDVPEAFTPEELAELADIAGDDARLTEAAERAENAQITQYLAGVPALLDRYDVSRNATRALIHAAMDARRLGAGPHVPLDWLAAAAPGYLTDAEYDALNDDWLPQALAYVTTPCNGIRGILTPVKTGAARNQRNRRPTGANAASTGRSAQNTPGPHYQLADYLDQHGRRHRNETIPPIDFWTAAANHAHPSDLTALGNAAWARGLYRDAAQLHKNATTHNDPRAAHYLVDHLHTLHPADPRPAQWAVEHASLDDPSAVGELLRVLRKGGAHEQVTALLARDPATHAALDSPNAAVWLLEELREAGAQEQMNTLLARDPATHVVLDHADAVVWLLKALRDWGAQEQAEVLAARAAAHVPLDHPDEVTLLLYAFRVAGAQEQINALLARDPATHAPLDNPWVFQLLEALLKAGAQEQTEVLAARAAAHVPLDHPDEVALLLYAFREVGAQEQMNTLLARDPATHVPLDNDTHLLPLLLGLLRVVEAQEQAEVLAARAAAHVPLDNPNTVFQLLEELREAGAQEQAEVLAARAAAHVPLDSPYAVAKLLEELWLERAQERMDTLAARGRATHVPLDDDTDPFARLLSRLREMGTQEQAEALAAQAAAHVPLDNPDAVAKLLEGLREAGAQEQMNTLLGRDPATHAPLDDPDAVAKLLEALWKAGAQEQMNTLLARDPATHAPLDHPFGVIPLLKALLKAGAEEQLSVLAARAAANAPLDHPFEVVQLLEELREVGAQEQLNVLTARLPALGFFEQFIGAEGNLGQFRFGREPNGSAASPWSWDDLE